MNVKERAILGILFYSALLLDQGWSVSLEEDVTLTYNQKLVLDKFKLLVNDRLPHDYMKEDIYLIRFLRDQNFNIFDAEKKLMRSLAWRKENNMDSVHNEDWTDFRSKYKYWIDGVDKEGRPILIIDVGEWEVRTAVITGQGKKLGRFMDKIMDEAPMKVRQLRREEGKNVTQYYHIFDMDGYTLSQHFCPACIPLSLRVLITYENYMPGGCHKIVLINTPQAFQALFELLKPMMSPLTRDSFFVYGRNKKEYSDALLKDIDKNQLPVDLGGTQTLPSY